MNLSISLSLNLFNLSIRQIRNRLRAFGHGADAGLGTVVGLELGDGIGNMATGGKEGARDLAIGQAVTVNLDRGVELQLGLDLDLPLILFAKAGTGDQVKHALR